MVLPSGSKTEMLGLADCMLRLGVWMVRKWPVEPVSAMHVDGIESSDLAGVKVAGSSRENGGRGLGRFTSITENARGGPVGPLS